MIWASTSLVPTPSVPLIRIGSSISLSAAAENRPPKPADATDNLGTVSVLDHLLNRVDGATALGGVDARRPRTSHACCRSSEPSSPTTVAPHGRQTVLIVAFISARAITARAVISTKQQVKPTKINLSPYGRFYASPCFSSQLRSSYFSITASSSKCSGLSRLRGLKPSINLSRPKLSGIATG